MKDRQWRSLLKDIQSQRCILLLGPGLSTANGESLMEAFSKSLIDELEAESVDYEKEAASNLPYIAQRFMSIPDIRRIDLEDEAVTFINKHTKDIPAIFKQLAKLPFYLIINTTPENFIEKALKEEGQLQVHSLHYNFKKDRDKEIPELTKGQVLIYNLFGTTTDPESMVFTEKEQIEFMKSIVRDDPSIPHKVISEFDDRKTYLFLGFDTDDWRFPLLLDSLQLEKLSSSISPKMEAFPVSPVTKSFFEDCYQFKFIDKNVDQFVIDLVERYKENGDANSRETKPEQALKTVLLYVDKDESLKEEFLTHLSDLKRKGFFDIWHKGMIGFGEEVEEVTNHKIEEAEVVLFLISADFLADEKMYEVEIPKALKRKEQGAKLFPVLIRPADIEENELGKLLPLPSNGKAVNSEFWNSKDEAFKQIISELKNSLFT